ncbi:hypothetical protein [Aquabacter spiritensis]|uniref:Uncharacterized protein n=1 Tax=Aquabacter spiritensis TaxID=933073 RepID=A0A4R3LPZ2_9HYPH|nr:hypothetical protein [Aquabacter spiritensis]TCT02261.1 hypothetical protein EDC64_114122 [Aquabacter spiritensis]
MIGERKKVPKKGMRNVATVQTRATSSTPANRTQAVSRFARLENERMRILRELDAWNARKAEAERMLAKVEAELGALQTLLLGAPPVASGPLRPAPRLRPAQKVQEPRPLGHGALLEY